jgi:hypothetical protein
MEHYRHAQHLGAGQAQSSWAHAYASPTRSTRVEQSATRYYTRDIPLSSSFSGSSLLISSPINERGRAIVGQTQPTTYKRVLGYQIGDVRSSGSTGRSITSSTETTGVLRGNHQEIERSPKSPSTASEYAALRRSYSRDAYQGSHINLSRSYSERSQPMNDYSGSPSHRRQTDYQSGLTRKEPYSPSNSRSSLGAASTPSRFEAHKDGRIATPQQPHHDTYRQQASNDAFGTSEKISKVGSEADTKPSFASYKATSNSSLSPASSPARVIQPVRTLHSLSVPEPTGGLSSDPSFRAHDDSFLDALSKSSTRSVSQYFLDHASTQEICTA